ncbi:MULTISPECIES: cupredoxin family protein [unclassified Pseudomonas]|uniref:cupredoxin domain-containing protein n=1 Tax=unclassified Pseudomonas TaxID=196821 RepID=UPI000D3C845F|nr:MULTISPECIES: cupredoxin family protein [unclassified Pseudomonas]RAU40788.1 copper-binding protein [Pseudomonas sp. RIT 409]RAU48190.1 copper-binding protein [Pseudomonas sp. RIT 412]
MFARFFAAFALLSASLTSQASPGEPFDFGHPASADQATRTIELTLGDMYFEPKSLTVKAGETVHFVLINKGQLLHEFNLGNAAMHAAHQQEMLKMVASGMLTATGMKHDMAGMDHGTMKHDDPNSVLVEPGQRAELTWAFTKATDLEFACNIPGHYQAGMVGKISMDE